MNEHVYKAGEIVDFASLRNYEKVWRRGGIVTGTITNSSGEVMYSIRVDYLEHDICRPLYLIRESALPKNLDKLVVL